VLKQLCALLVYTYNHSLKNKRGLSLWLTLVCKTIFSIYSWCAGAWGSTVVKALCYYSNGPGIESRWRRSPGFVSGLPAEPCALESTQHLKMSTRDFSWGKGGQCVRLMTYHPCSAECQVFWGLNLPGPLGPSWRPVVGDLYLFIPAVHFGQWFAIIYQNTVLMFSILPKHLYNS
jgi:hypothetical protein